MTPEQAQEIYHAARVNAYETVKSDYSPLNQQKVILAGFQAVIDAVTNEVDMEYVKKLLAQVERG